MKLTFVRRILVGAAVMLAFSSLAAADTIFYEYALFGGEGNQESTSGIVSFPASAPLPKFNTAGGTLVLESVQLYIRYYVTPQIDVYSRDTEGTQTFTAATASVPLTLTGPSLTTGQIVIQHGPIDSDSPAVTPIESYDPNTGYLPLVAGMPIPKARAIPPGPGCFNKKGCVEDAYNSYGGVTYTDTEYTPIETNLINLALYITPPGPPQFFSAVTTSVKGGTYGGTGETEFVSFGGSAVAGGTIGVIYTYRLNENVPEPMTMMLVGSAVVSLGVLMRRRNKAKSA